MLAEGFDWLCSQSTETDIYDNRSTDALLFFYQSTDESSGENKIFKRTSWKIG